MPLIIFNSKYYILIYSTIVTKEFLFIFYPYSRTYLPILETGDEREREKERNTGVKENVDRLPLVHTPVRDWTLSLGICPDQESNLRSFGLQGMLQPTEPRQLKHKREFVSILQTLNLEVYGPTFVCKPREKAKDVLVIRICGFHSTISLWFYYFGCFFPKGLVI